MYCSYIWNQPIVNYRGFVFGGGYRCLPFFGSMTFTLHAASQLLDISPTSSLFNAGLYAPISWILNILNLQCYILIVDHMKKNSIQSRREVLTKCMRIMNQ